MAPVEVLAPFRAIPGEAGIRAGFDYALPVDALDATLNSGIERCRDWHRRMAEPLRVEFNELAWPGLAMALEKAGLSLDSAHPVMVCPRSVFRPAVSSGVSVNVEALPPSAAGRALATGAVDGRVVGYGSLSGIEGIGELYGVITEPGFRRRGVASALSSSLIRWWYEHGADALIGAAAAADEPLVFLEAETDEAAALYRKLGFSDVDRRLTFVDG